MKSPYLILAVTAVVVTCEPQRSNNDIIWYPVDDDDGIFISTFGEKRRTSQSGRWRSHRRARFSGMEPPFPLPPHYDPTENRDPSFFHNINERRPLVQFPPIPKVPPSFLNDQQRPETYQEILNEVFNYNKYPQTSEYPGGGNRPGNQWVNPTKGDSNKGSIWGSTSGSFPQRPTNQWGGSRPNSEWTDPKRPTNQSDKLIFPDDLSGSTTSTTTPTNLIPTDPPTMSPCERQCPVTPEFNPVCGSDGVTYTNAGRLKCANMCGKSVRLSHYGNCGRTPLVTPLVSNTPRQKFRGFW